MWRTFLAVFWHFHFHLIFQVDFGALVMVRGLATQGRHEVAQWVSSFVLSHSSVATNFKFYQLNQTVKVSYRKMSIIVHQNILETWVHPLSIISCLSFLVSNLPYFLPDVILSASLYWEVILVKGTSGRLIYGCVLKWFTSNFVRRDSKNVEWSVAAKWTSVKN